MISLTYVQGTFPSQVDMANQTAIIEMLKYLQVELKTIESEFNRLDQSVPAREDDFGNASYHDDVDP